MSERGSTGVIGWVAPSRFEPPHRERSEPNRSRQYARSLIKDLCES